MPVADNIWTNIKYYPVGGEASPFVFKGREYYLLNLSPRHEELPADTPEHAVIVDVETGKWSKRIFEGYYFISAYSNPRDGRVYCLGSRVKAGWISHAIDVIYSDDLENWSQPFPLIENYPGRVYNTSVTFDGTRYIMHMEVRDPGKAFGFKFLESEDMLHWKLIEDAAFYNNICYLGAGAIYYIAGQKYFYMNYLNELVNPVTGELYYETNIVRSYDLKNWERGKRALLKPDFQHEVLCHPGIFEINASDVEFIELNGKVKAYSCGGNQLGAHDWFTCEYQGTMGELFKSFF